jgi:hypothetical protein
MAPENDLEPTAALVMIWARDLYRTGSAAKFCSRLDLSAGMRMKQECDAVCPWYDQVILNRKWLIRNLAADFISAAGGSCQVILPAAGKSPLALELLDACGDAVASVIEMDIKGMEEKERLYRHAAPDHAAKIHCITADLTDCHGTAGLIAESGRYDPDLPAVVIPEGISYYLPPPVLAGIIAPFRSMNCTNHVILDYLLPCKLVRPERRIYPRDIWRIINRECNQSGTVTYSPGAMEETLHNGGCRVVRHYPMHSIERTRTGSNQYFPDVHDGWIQIVSARL